MVVLFAFEINYRARRVLDSSVLALDIPKRPKFELQTIFQDPPFQILLMVGLMQSLCYHLHTRPTFAYLQNLLLFKSHNNNDFYVDGTRVFSEHQKLPDFGLQVEQLRHQQI